MGMGRQCLVYNERVSETIEEREKCENERASSCSLLLSWQKKTFASHLA